MFPIVIVHDFLQEHQKVGNEEKGGNKLVDKTTSQSKFAYKPVHVSTSIHQCNAQDVQQGLGVLRDHDR